MRVIYYWMVGFLKSDSILRAAYIQSIVITLMSISRYGLSF